MRAAPRPSPAAPRRRRSRRSARSARRWAPSPQANGRRSPRLARSSPTRDSLTGGLLQALPREEHLIRSLKLEPASLQIQNAYDERRVLVLGVTENNQLLDLTAQATFKPSDARVEVDAQGYVHPKEQGASEIVVSAAGREAKLPVTVEAATTPPVRFVRDVMPILSKAGCNQGTCHGSAKGKNGFKLSLRGYDPEYDFQALINDLSGRRFNRSRPLTKRGSSASSGARSASHSRRNMT